MSRRAGWYLLLVPLVTTCGRPAGPRSASGRLQIERDGRPALDAAAAASRCVADTTLAVTATSAAAAAAIALRITGPGDSALTLRVVPPPAPAGAASVALRVLGDSASPALIAERGEVRLDPGTALAGTLDVIAPTLPGAPDTVHLTGRFSGVAVTDDLCPAAGR